MKSWRCQYLLTMCQRQLCEKGDLFAHFLIQEILERFLPKGGRLVINQRDLLHLAKRTSMARGSHVQVREIMKRWDELYVSRYIISPLADCFCITVEELNNPQHLLFLRYMKKGGRIIVYSMNAFLENPILRGRQKGSVSQPDRTKREPRSIYEFEIPPYKTL